MEDVFHEWVGVDSSFSRLTSRLVPLSDGSTDGRTSVRDCPTGKMEACFKWNQTTVWGRPPTPSFTSFLFDCPRIYSVGVYWLRSLTETFSRRDELGPLRSWVAWYLIKRSLNDKVFWLKPRLWVKRPLYISFSFKENVLTSLDGLIVYTIFY